MDVHDIIVKFLDDGGFDGLCNGDIECGCHKSDLAPCGESCTSCQPAYQSDNPPEGFDTWFTTEKPLAS